jgi:hypothetical protein
MPHEQTLQGLLKEIDGLVELSPSKFLTANKRGEGICKAIEEFKNAIEPNAHQRDSLDKLFASVDRAAGKLNQSVLNLQKDGRLRGDWARFARRDLIRLKDEALALREFLVANVNSFKPSSRASARPSVDLKELLEVLHKDRAISERTFVMLMAHLSQNGRPKPNDPAIIEQISRICAYLSELHEIRRVSGDA